MKFDENLAALHGYLCADGYVSRNLPHQKHKYYIIGLRNQNLTLLNDFQKKFYAVFSEKPKLIENERCHMYSKEIYYKLIPLGPFHSNNWVFPELPKNLLKYWLRAFFDCEGWVIAKKAKDRRVAAESINQAALQKIRQELLKKFGIHSSFYVKKKKNIAGLHIYGKENLIKFQKDIGFLHPDKSRKLNNAITSYVEYEWIFPTENKKSKEYLDSLITKRAKIKKPHTIRFSSIIETNIDKLKKKILIHHNIESNKYLRVNGQGRTYYELAIYKENDSKKLVNLNLLSKKERLKLKSGNR
jgi:hypothetical protein